MSERFYINWPLGPGPLEVGGPEAHHLAVVCRLGPGDEVWLFNGDGREYRARIVESGRRLVRLDVLEAATPQRELPFNLEVAAPIPKGDRAQFLVEKLTELGVTSYVPLLCRRSVIDPRQGKLDKLQRHVIEASKQCGRNVLMHVSEPVDWATYCQNGRSSEARWLAHPGGPARLSELEGPRAPGTLVRCAVGPEGGFADDEVAVAHGAGWRLVDLGPRILRMETAAVVLAARAALSA